MDNNNFGKFSLLIFTEHLFLILWPLKFMPKLSWYWSDGVAMMVQEFCQRQGFLWVIAFIGLIARLG